MDLDKALLKKLVEPLQANVGLKPSEYFKALDNVGVVFSDDKSKVDEKFLLHFRHAVETRAITNSEGSKLLEDFGIVIGADGYMALSESATIKCGEKPELQKKIFLWAMDNIVGVVFAAVIAAALLAWLRLSYP